MLMVKAGNPVDAVIDQLTPYLEPGDLVIDGGNSFYRDTERRSEALAKHGINFMGVGISGGEEGALWGPSIMPGGQREAYKQVEPIFHAMAAKVGGEACVTYIGPRGSGHYVKMVHNGIEYGVMQLIAETYDLMHRGLGIDSGDLAEIYSRWNESHQASFLIEITAEILARQDDETGKPLVDMILDRASQKGTGKWTSQEAFDLGVPVPTISTAVEARSLSSYKFKREKAGQVFASPQANFSGDREAFIEALGEALYVATLMTYIQGMDLLAEASQEYNFQLDLGEIARIWRGGCIIRARMLKDIRKAYSDDPELSSLMLAPVFREDLINSQAAWRQVVGTGVELGIPVPAMSAGLAYFDGCHSSRLPANLIQAQRDYFGAHTYQRVDKPGSFHTEWSG
jgi:6-phosphogluconate dehydrogenase